MSGGGYGQSPMYGSFGNNRQSYGGGGFQGYQGQPNYTLGAGAPQYGPTKNPNEVQMTGFGKEYPLGDGRPMYGPTKDPNRVDMTGFSGQNPLAAQSMANTGMFAQYGQQTPFMPPEFQSTRGAPGTPINGGPQQSAPGFMVNQRAAPQQAPGQTFEQFAQTLGNSGMTSGQIADLYAKQSQPINFGQNTGVGTQRPPGFTPPSTWGNQAYGFDPKSISKVGPEHAWYFGVDAIGRPVNQQTGDAYSQFRSPADGYQRTNPWQKG